MLGSELGCASGRPDCRCRQQSTCDYRCESLSYLRQQKILVCSSGLGMLTGAHRICACTDVLTDLSHSPAMPNCLLVPVPALGTPTLTRGWGGGGEGGDGTRVA